MVSLKQLHVIGALVTILLSSCSSSSTNGEEEIPVPEGYKLVWSDEFNNDGAPDSTYWSHEIGFVRNEEAQWYQPNNAWCKNGLLTIEARREKVANPNYEENSNDWRRKNAHADYTASSINTNGKKSWQYGRFEMRGKIDVLDGCWPAWWTLGVKGQWPSNGEIDIMEYYRKMLLANIATGTNQQYKAKWFDKKFDIDSLGGQKWADEFHVWRMDWDENAIALYLDDVLLNKVEVEKLYNDDGSNVNPFRQPHYMLLNFAVGGNNGGDPTNTEFPRQFLVDYVRVYQKI